MKFSEILHVAIITATLSLVACSSTGPQSNKQAQRTPVTADYVDLKRFMGRWYVISNIPYWGERGYVGSYVEYALREDGDIDDFFFGHKESFDQPIKKITLKDSVVNTRTNAEWRASPFWPISFPYLILYVDTDYQTAIIGYPDRSLGWIFSRRPDVSDQALKVLYAKLSDYGYNTNQFLRVPQNAEEIGQPGFQ